jgi:Flp pilus assembly protein TadD
MMRAGEAGTYPKEPASHGLMVRVTSMITLENMRSEPGFGARDGWRALRAVLLCGGAALSGCANMNPERFTAARPNPSVSSPMTPETVTNAARASTAYERDPKSVTAAITYARALREFGNNQSAADVLAHAVQYHPDNGELLSEYAKSLTASGQNSAALPVYASAEKSNRSDWSLYSAEGIALDQLGRHERARDRYNTALKLSPNNPDVLCNLAFSYTMTGDLTQAETILRAAVKQPDASAQARQNLAMVVGLQGRFTEAQSLARADLDVATADHNVSVMRQMYSQPEIWTAAKEERGPSLASNAPSNVMADAVTSAPADPKPAGVTSAIKPAAPAVSAVPAKVDTKPLAPPAVDSKAPQRATVAPANAIGAEKAVTPTAPAVSANAKPAASADAKAVPAQSQQPARHHASPAVQSVLAIKPRQVAQSNAVDETFFAFN